MKEKIVLAYSGGLDTTAIIPWLKENYDYDVICACIDCGQAEELDGLEQRAISTGASKCYIVNVVDELCEDYIMPCVKAGAVYENKYLLGTSMARPLIAKKLVEIARKEGAVAICHGATGKGNDQIRFELGIKALAPDLKIIAAWRSDKWNMNSREEEIEYCRKHGIHLPFSADSSYSRDRNIWHISHEGLELEDPANEPNYEHLLVLGVTPEKAPDKETEVSITFESGTPVALNGRKMKVSEIITELNELGGKNGIGIVDIVENRVVGMKSRGVYETPGGTILMEAHDQLEELILDRETMEYKKNIGNKLASVVYEGKWFTPLREALCAFVDSTQKYVTGEAKMKLYKGNIIRAGTTSPYSLYNESLASFTTGDLYDHHDASGFITLFGLSSKVRGLKMQSLEGKNKK
ncbi:MAG TPA: argininosuccinate synthase [Candidatus Protoclostridium stercorigallinarum]|uniref:Argininosuccinate synthase n=1 Tax=Candidatus Protoclostridium stercorigallinarum TaxID=2838741 RepID=A0A9D1Q1K7_9FIRM|nr:argininosuccinate synthase [Candidatus Protoclostridium stercorigallinarum]